MIKFNTAYHLPAGTPLSNIVAVEVQVDEAHSAEAKAALLIGAPTLSDFVKQGLTEGWISIVN